MHAYKLTYVGLLTLNVSLDKKLHAIFAGIYSRA